MSEATSEESKTGLKPKQYNVPVRFNDISSFDGAFTFMKERFTEEMRRIDDEMALLSKNLLRLTNEAKTYHANVTADAQGLSWFWDAVATSPLVEGEGTNKILSLQFDVSQFEPEEVAVKILDNVLVVTAQHEEKSDASVIHNQYHREFRMPAVMDPATIESALSKDGVLTVKMPLNLTELVITDKNYI